MKPELFHMEFYETYYFCNMLNNLMASPQDYLRGLYDFFGELETSKFLPPFPKCSALHKFTHHVLDSVRYESMQSDEIDRLIKYETDELWVNRALKKHRLAHVGFRGWLQSHGRKLEDATEDDLSEYHVYLYDEGLLEKLEDQMVDEVFYIMFSNREFLRKYNTMIAGYVHELEIDGLDEKEAAYFRKNGVLKRVAIPAWVRRAVFFRDRGACGRCNRDISGLVTLRSQKNFDHIVPLAVGGINDVTNIQLLCDACNGAKLHRNTFTSTRYERWY
jgi:hypothetical protein